MNQRSRSLFNSPYALLVAFASLFSLTLLAFQPANAAQIEVQQTSNTSTLLARVWRGGRSGLSLAPSRRPSVTGLSSAMPASPPAVLGAGTVGKISLWIGTSPSGNSILGDSIITQSGLNIGIGIDVATSKLTVRGMIEATLGGYKFPDGTVQTTAALSGLQSVFHDVTLRGDGTIGSPLGVAVPLNLVGTIPFPDALLKVTNTGDGGKGVNVAGGDAGA